MANDYNDKVSRVLSLYQRLMEGEVVDKEVEAARYANQIIRKFPGKRLLLPAQLPGSG